MGIALRRVPRDWEHPTDHKTDNYVSQIAYRPPHEWDKFRPLLDESWDEAARDWWRQRIWFAIKRAALYPLALLGLIEAGYDIADGWSADVHGAHPEYFDYRPHWGEKTRTHYQLYEDVSEGTPISPVCASIEELAKWCADQTRPVWVNTKLSYNQWLHFLRGGGSAPSGIYTPQGGFKSGAQ